MFSPRRRHTSHRRPSPNPHPATRRHIRHLFREHPKPRRPGLQRRPITRPRHQRLPLRNNLVLHNLHAAPKIILRQQYRPPRILHRQRPIFLPIEIASVALGILILHLHQPLLPRRPLRHRINNVHRRLHMMHISRRIQPRLRRRDCLKRIRPELPLLRLRLLRKTRTIHPHCPSRLATQQIRRHRFLHHPIPLRISRRPTKLRLLLIERRRRGHHHRRLRRRLHRWLAFTPRDRQHPTRANHTPWTSHSAHLRSPSTRPSASSPIL